MSKLVCLHSWKENNLCNCCVSFCRASLQKHNFLQWWVISIIKFSCGRREIRLEPWWYSWDALAYATIFLLLLHASVPVDGWIHFLSLSLIFNKTNWKISTYFFSVCAAPQYFPLNRYTYLYYIASTRSCRVWVSFPTAPTERLTCAPSRARAQKAAPEVHKHNRLASHCWLSHSIISLLWRGECWEAVVRIAGRVPSIESVVPREQQTHKQIITQEAKPHSSRTAYYSHSGSQSILWLQTIKYGTLRCWPLHFTKCTLTKKKYNQPPIKT